MVKIQLDIDEYLDKNIRLFMVVRALRNKEEAIKFALNKYFLIDPVKRSTDEDKKNLELFRIRQDHNKD